VPDNPLSVPAFLAAFLGCWQGGLLVISAAPVPALPGTARTGRRVRGPRFAEVPFPVRGLCSIVAKSTKAIAGAVQPAFNAGADSLDQIPLRYVLAFTAVIITTAREYLAADGAPPEQADRMHAAFTKSVMPHVTVWTRAYVDAASW
jgi:hypothetical protein